MTPVEHGSNSLVAANPFWTAVCRCTEVLTPRTVAASNINDAAATAFALAGRRYGFRRPRELIDLDGRFRHFVLEGRTMVGKRTNRRDAISELWNSRCAKRRLGNAGRLHPLVPSLTRGIEAAGAILVSDDCGPSLAHNPALLRQQLPWEGFIEQMDRLLAAGIEWSGFLPRNVIPQGSDRLVLIDWESCQFVPHSSRVTSVGDLTLLFWSIAWAGHYGFEPELFQAQLCDALCLTPRRDPLDAFELAYASIVGPELEASEIRRRCSAATIATESVALDEHVIEPDGTARYGLVSRAEAGHLLNELLPTHLSVLYTFASNEHLRTAGDGAYADFVSLIGNILVFVTPCDGLENQPEQRRQLLLLVLATMTAVLLEGADASELRSAESADDLLDRIRACSTAVAEFMDTYRTDRPSDPEHPSVRRLLKLSAPCLSVADEAKLTGLKTLGNEVVSLASGWS